LQARPMLVDPAWAASLPVGSDPGASARAAPVRCGRRSASRSARAGPSPQGCGDGCGEASAVGGARSRGQAANGCRASMAWPPRAGRARYSGRNFHRKTFAWGVGGQGAGGQATGPDSRPFRLGGQGVVRPGAQPGARCPGPQCRHSVEGSPFAHRTDQHKRPDGDGARQGLQQRQIQLVGAGCNRRKADPWALAGRPVRPARQGWIPWPRASGRHRPTIRVVGGWLD